MALVIGRGKINPISLRKNDTHISMQLQDGENVYHIVAPDGTAMEHLNTKDVVFFVGDAKGGRNKKLTIYSYVIVPIHAINQDVMRHISAQLVERILIDK